MSNHWFQKQVDGFGFARRLEIGTCFQSHIDSSLSFISPSSLEMSSQSSMVGIKSLGIDYGLMRTGVAVTMGYAPSPLTILHNSNQTEIVQEVLKMITGESATQVVVGLPLHKNGTLSEQANLTSAFASHMAFHCHSKFGPNFPVYLFDERYSSKEAEARIRSSSTSPTNRNLNSFQLSGTLDADSACIILEHFYAAEGEGKIRVYPPEDKIEASELAFQQQMLLNQQQNEQLQKMRESSLNAKQEAMRRAKLLEKQMERDGTLKKNKKGKKKNKKKKVRTVISTEAGDSRSSDTNGNKDKWITL